MSIHQIGPREFSEDESVAKVEDSETQTEEEVYPDGGFRAWIVLLGSFTCFFATFGYVNSWGVFQAYYHQQLLRHSSPSQIAWIGSIQHAMFFIPAVLVGRLFDIGFFRIPFTSGSILIVVATFLIPECKLYWHFMLCQGFGIGVGSGLMFCIMISIVTHWWKKRRGLALGITTAGGSLGATILPIVLRELITRLGFAWAIRTLGFIVLFLLVIGNLCLARRLPPTKAPGGILGLHVFWDNVYISFCASTFVLFLGLFTVLIYISSSAIEFGMSRDFAFYLVSVTNFSSGFGRIVCGILGDRIGSVNVLILMTTFTAVTTFAWPFCRTIPTITVISALYGFGTGAWIALFGSAVGQMGGIEDIGRRIGAVHAFSGLSTLCGPPLAGLLLSTDLGYTAVGYFAGSALLVGTAILVVTRLLAVGDVWAKY